MAIYESHELVRNDHALETHMRIADARHRASSSIPAAIAAGRYTMVDLTIWTYTLRTYYGLPSGYRQSRPAGCPVPSHPFWRINRTPFVLGGHRTKWRGL